MAATVSGTVTVTANATDSVGVTGSVQFQLDGANLGESVVTRGGSSTYSYSWKSRPRRRNGHSHADGNRQRRGGEYSEQQRFVHSDQCGCSAGNFGGERRCCDFLGGHHHVDHVTSRRTRAGGVWSDEQLRTASSALNATLVTLAFGDADGTGSLDDMITIRCFRRMHRERWQAQGISRLRRLKRACSPQGS